jgi:hypothetical protein
MQLLASHLAGAWSQGSGTRTPLVNPATEEVLAEVSAGGHDLAGAFAFARGAGAAELAKLSFAQRGALLGALAKAIHGAREELIALAVANGGNTRGDAKFDIDGGAATLSYYAELGARLGGSQLLPDGDPVQVGRTARMGGQHVWARRQGVAVHINAFNFPGWGLCEKLAPALLAGMPVIAKPATATALVAHRMAELFVPLLPAGALSLLVGPAGALLATAVVAAADWLDFLPHGSRGSEVWAFAVAGVTLGVLPALAVYLVPLAPRASAVAGLAFRGHGDAASHPAPRPRVRVLPAGKRRSGAVRDRAGEEERGRRDALAAGRRQPLRAAGRIRAVSNVRAMAARGRPLGGLRLRSRDLLAPARARVLESPRGA